MKKIGGLVPYNTDRIRVSLDGLYKSRELIKQMYIDLLQTEIAGLVAEAANLKANVLDPLDAEIIAVIAALQA